MSSDPLNHAVKAKLFNFNFSAGFFQLFFHLGSIFFADSFFNSLGRTFDQIFSFFQTQTGDSADFFNDVDFVGTGFDQNDIEFGFFFSSGGAGTGSGGGTIWSNNPYPLEASDSLRHYAGALCAAFSAQGGTGQFYFVQALPDSVDKTLQSQLAEAGYPEEQVAAYKAAGGLPYLDNTDTVFGQVYQGMEVVDAIACADTVKTEDGTDTFRPAEDIVISHITVTTYTAE